MFELIKALEIFMKYYTGDYPTVCSHDTLYITDEIKAEDVSDNDKRRLEEYGFLVDEYGQFYSFKYGS